MKRLIAVICMVLLAGVVPAVRADDMSPPPWRGDAGSTYQQWEFSTADLPPTLTSDSFNPYGDPDLTLIPIGQWEDQWGGRDGVWPLSGLIIVTIPNNPVPNDYKLLRIQLTWAGEVGHPSDSPCVSITANGQYIPAGNLILLDTTDITLDATGVQDAGEYWRHTTYDYKIIPNPEWETITIGGSIMVDELVIDTICIPEPGTMSLLTIGGAGLIIRRRLKRRGVTTP